MFIAVAMVDSVFQACHVENIMDFNMGISVLGAHASL